MVAVAELRSGGAVAGKVHVSVVAVQTPDIPNGTPSASGDPLGDAAGHEAPIRSQPGLQMLPIVPPVGVMPSMVVVAKVTASRRGEGHDYSTHKKKTKTESV